MTSPNQLRHSTEGIGHERSETEMSASVAEGYSTWRTGVRILVQPSVYSRDIHNFLGGHGSLFVRAESAL